MEKRYFTASEIDAVIPQLEQIFDSIETCRQRAEKLAAQIMANRGSSTTAHAVDGQVARSQIEFLTQAVQEYLQHIYTLGGIAKDLEQGLVDFPGELDGREVWLCWKKGEREVRFWHPLDAGFSQRKILPHLVSNNTLH